MRSKHTAPAAGSSEREPCEYDRREQFDRLFIEMLPELHPRLLRLVRTQDAAQDLLQDLYLRIAQERRAQQLVHHPNPGGYLYLTALNIARDGWRRSKRLSAALDRMGSDWTEGSDGGLDKLESRLDLWAALHCLSRKESLAVFLVDLAGYSLQETAQILGIRKATVQHNRDRALLRLRQTAALDCPPGLATTGQGPAGRVGEAGR
jgi:RNA polymerase sigma factor (sigma-70 family)